MSKLKNVVEYSKTRVNLNEISLSQFVTTDSILQNKSGIAEPANLPKLPGKIPGFAESDILVGNIRPYLKKIWFADKKGGCSADVLVFKVKEGHHPRFVYYNMFQDDFFNHMMRGSKGTKMPRGDKNQILDYHIPDFSLPTQRRIAAVLSALDAKIELNRRINAELEALAKTLYDYWFVQFDFPDASGKPYKSSGGKMVWSKELRREVPEGWEVGSLLDIATYTNGLPCQKFRPIEGEEQLRVIKIKEMHDGFSNDCEFVRANVPQKAIIENGDVLFSWSASLEVQIWSNGRGALNQHIFKVTSDKYPKSFYFHQLVNYLQHFKMMAENRKTTMGHITQEHLQQSRIVLPPTQLTQKLEKIIAPIFQKKIKNDSETRHLTTLRDWLLPLLMNGQVGVG